MLTLFKPVDGDVGLKARPSTHVTHKADVSECVPSSADVSENVLGMLHASAVEKERRIPRAHRLHIMLSRHRRCDPQLLWRLDLYTMGRPVEAETSRSECLRRLFVESHTSLRTHTNSSDTVAVVRLAVHRRWRRRHVAFGIAERRQNFCRSWVRRQGQGVRRTIGQYLYHLRGARKRHQRRRIPGQWPRLHHRCVDYAQPRVSSRNAALQRNPAAARACVTSFFAPGSPAPARARQCVRVSQRELQSYTWCAVSPTVSRGLNSPARAFVVICATAASDDSSCRIWDLRVNKQSVLDLQDDTLLCGSTSIANSASGRFVFAGYDDSQVYVWDTLRGKYVGNFQHDNRVTCLGLSPDNGAICSGSWDKELKIWA